MRVRSASTNGRKVAGGFLLFLVLFLLLHGVRCGPRGLFLTLLRVQILLRSLWLGSPRPPLPHETGWKHPFLPLAGLGAVGGGGTRQRLARLDKGEPATRGRGDQRGVLEGPALSASSPLCGSGVFFPHGTQDGLFRSLSSILRRVGGGGRRKKGTPPHWCRYSK